MLMFDVIKSKVFTYAVYVPEVINVNTVFPGADGGVVAIGP